MRYFVKASSAFISLVEIRENIPLFDDGLHPEVHNYLHSNVSIKILFQIALTNITFLPSNNTEANQKELILARDVLEIGAQWAVAVKDVKAFERYMSQLKCYYFDYKYVLMYK